MAASKATPSLASARRGSRSSGVRREAAAAIGGRFVRRQLADRGHELPFQADVEVKREYLVELRKEGSETLDPNPLQQAPQPKQGVAEILLPHPVQAVRHFRIVDRLRLFTDGTLQFRAGFPQQGHKIQRGLLAVPERRRPHAFQTGIQPLFQAGCPLLPRFEGGAKVLHSPSEFDDAAAKGGILGIGFFRCGKRQTADQ